MTLVASELSVRHFRVPTAEERTLQVPAIGQARSFLDDNRTLLNLDAETMLIGGESLPELRRSAQIELIALARAHTIQYLPEHPLAQQSDIDRRMPEEQTSPSLIVSGHQPELFHPGVWYKNFVLDSIAQQSETIGVNLIIDNDLCSTAGIHVPSGTLTDPRSAYVPFDAVADAMPWEDRRTIDDELFESFGDRLASELIDNLPPPIACSMWKDAGASSIKMLSLGNRIAALRHRLEFGYGLRNLEVPLSEVCRSEIFASFASALINDADRFQRIHNDSLDEYRRVNRIRSKTHPVPDLELDGEWIETPFWIWSTNHPTRRHLYVRIHGERITLSNRNGLTFDADRSSLRDWVYKKASDGIRIRPRALITTMYARLMLSDLFVHGIGGAKYDELTDLLIKRFFNLAPPKFMVVSATVQLPLKLSSVDSSDITNLKQLKRSLTYHPERFLETQLEASVGVQELVETKRDLIREIPKSGSKRAWHHAVVDVNRKMQPFLQTRYDELESELETLQRELHDQQLVASREVPFVSFPPTLGEQLAQWSDESMNI